MKVLITGGCGFVGRNLASQLNIEGHKVALVDNLVEGGGGLRPGQWPRHLHKAIDLQFFKLDVLDLTHTELEKYDVIFHLAAVVGGRLNMENFPLSVAQDLMIDSHLMNELAKIRHDNKPKLVYFSSSAAYPIGLQTEGSNKSLKESMLNLNDMILGMPDLTYGWSKLTGEYLVKNLVEKYGYKAVCFRPFSGYGKDQDLSYPFPSILRRVFNARNNGEAIDVWGSGEQLRDFIYIKDVVDGILDIYPQVNDGSAVNLSTGKATSFNELTRRLCMAIHSEEFEIQNLIGKPEGVFCRVGDTTLQNQYGFSADITIEESINLMKAI